MKSRIKIFEQLKLDKLSGIKENVQLNVALGISFIISLLLTLHPSNLNMLNELGNLKWIIAPAGIIGMTGLSFVGIFGYIYNCLYHIIN